MFQNSCFFLLIINYYSFNLMSFLNLLQNFNFLDSYYCYYHFPYYFNYATLKIFQFVIVNLVHCFFPQDIVIIIIFSFFNFMINLELNFENFWNQYFMQMQKQLTNQIFFYFLLKNWLIFFQLVFFLLNKLQLYVTLFI